MRLQYDDTIHTRADLRRCVPHSNPPFSDKAQRRDVKCQSARFRLRYIQDPAKYPGGVHGLLLLIAQEILVFSCLPSVFD